MQGPDKLQAASMIGEGREKHLLKKTNPELQRVYEVVLSSL